MSTIELLRRIPWPLTICAALLLGCGPPAPTGDTVEAEPPGSEAKETVFDDMIQTQDKARAVEGVTFAQKAAMDAAIESAEGGTSEGDPKEEQE